MTKDELGAVWTIGARLHFKSLCEAKWLYRFLKTRRYNVRRRFSKEIVICVRESREAIDRALYEATIIWPQNLDKRFDITWF